MKDTTRAAEHACWLIETTATPVPLYFAGWDWEWKDPSLDAQRVKAELFKRDANEAIRFPTKATAENMLKALLTRKGQDAETMAVLRMHLSCYRVAEHVFDYTPRALPDQAVQQKPLDDPRLQELFSAAIDGALTSGYQGVSPAPAGHWLEYWWKKGAIRIAVLNGASCD